MVPVGRTPALDNGAQGDAKPWVGEGTIPYDLDCKAPDSRKKGANLDDEGDIAAEMGPIEIQMVGIADQEAETGGHDDPGHTAVCHCTCRLAKLVCGGEIGRQVGDATGGEVDGVTGGEVGDVIVGQVGGMAGQERCTHGTDHLQD